jgi:hypothetical protein
MIENKLPPADFMQTAHEERLKAMKACDETDGVAPCKIGDIIVEAASESETKVWKRQN